MKVSPHARLVAAALLLALAPLAGCGPDNSSTTTSTSTALATKAYACTAASQCLDALKNGNWKPGDVGACQTADCTAKTCKLVNKAAGDTCDDKDALDCQSGTCAADGKCEAAKVIASDKCVIGGECLASGAAKSDNPCEVCEPAASQSEWSAAPADTPCASDGKDCTIDSCKGKTCDSSGINDKGCLIASTCIPANTPKPDAPCLVCDPSLSKTDWSPAKLGTACADSLDCTVDSCDGKGSCDSSTLKTDTCLVQDGGKPRCMAKGEPQSSDLTCQVCDPTKNSKELSVLNDDAACIPGKPCLLGKCKAGTCENKGANPDSCLIAADNACVAAKDLNPNNPCQACDPSVSQTVWTDLAAAIACPTDGIDCTADHCDGGGKCLHELQNSACTAKDSACTTGVCDASQGCVAMPNDTTVVCEGDGVACTIEVCDGKSNCTKTGTATNTLCDDKVACTLDTCDAVKGCQHTAQDTACSDGNVCTADSCDATAGCSNPPLSSGAPCKLDDLACTSDACQAGSCVAPIAGGNCMVGGVCYSDGETAQGGCSWCNSAIAQDKWTLVADSAPCQSDNQLCTDDKCSAGQCGHTANTLPCATDNVACTLDICAGGGCQHQAQASACNDGLPCTDNQCDVSKGCVFVDNCAWGHECSQTAKACLTLGGAAVELVKTSLADPNPTNAALGRHDLDSTGNTQRTWVAWQSQSCATVVGGAWNITQGAQLRAMALDPQIAAVKAVPTTVNLPQAALWNGSTTVCQAFPTILKDSQTKERVWLSWLESDPGQSDPAKACVSAGGKGGVLRLARLDGKTGNGAVDVAGEVCGKTANAANPLFLTPGVAVLDGSGSASADPTQRALLAIRPTGNLMAAWDSSFALKAKPVEDAASYGQLGSLAPFAVVHPVVVDMGPNAAPSARYLVLGVNDTPASPPDPRVVALYANQLSSTGGGASMAAWATATPASDVFANVTAVCSLDAAVDDAGTLGVVVVTRTGGNDRVELITRTANGSTAVATLKSATSKGDCRVGIAGARVGVGAAGWMTTTFTSLSANVALSGTVEVQYKGATNVPNIGTYDAGTFDSAATGGPTAALAWRGLVQPNMVGGVATGVVEAVAGKNSYLLFWTWKP